MRKFFSVFAAWVLLLSNCNLMYADVVPVDGFIAAWDNDTLLPTNVYFDWKNFVECDINNPVRGCVKGTKNQFTWSFENPGDVEIKKMVIPTDNPWEFWIHLMVRGKNTHENGINTKACYVVALDASRTMQQVVSLVGGGTSDSKFSRAKSWSIIFSEILNDNLENSKIWLVLFASSVFPKSSLFHWVFTDDLFNTDNFGALWTNIQWWLIGAYNILEWGDCDEKFVVLMSDWDATNYYDDDWVLKQDDILSNSKAIQKAEEMRNLWIIIYTIWYWADDSGEETLKRIAYNDSYYFPVSNDNNIMTIFENIWNQQISELPLSLTSMVDSLWNKILWDEINIAEESSITESWVVYSFPIRIDPTASWWVKTNDGLTLNYIDANWVAASLTIPASKSSEIYWTQPKCDWSYPSGNWVLTWKWEFTQIWTGGNWAWGQNESGPKGSEDTYVLSPSMLTWEYTGSETPWECKWTCLPWYQLNQQWNGCEEIVNTHTVNVWVSPEWYGSVDNSKVTADHWSSIVVDNSKWTVRVWDVTVTVTPKSWDAQYTYEFSWWNNTCGDEVTDDCSITAEFKRSVNKYLITWKNWDGAVLDSWMVEYGTTPVYNWVNPPVRPADASNTYTFNGWNPVVTWVTQAQVYTAVYISSANTHTVSIWVSPEWYGNVDKRSVTENYGATISENWNKISIWGEVITATPETATSQYTYEFSWWNNSCWNTLTNDCTITAEFKRSVNKYLITWKNWDGAVLDSWMVEYGTTPVYNWVNPPVRPADASNTYTFNGWNPVVTWVTQAQVYTAVYISSANTHTVSIWVSPEWYGNVDKRSVTENYGATISENWNKISIWGEVITATPETATSQYTYEFSWWNYDDCGDILTSSCTIVAEFRRVKNIKLNIVSNNSEYWNVDVSSGYFYPDTLSLFTSGNELRVLKVTIWPTKTLLTSIASPSASDEYYSYRFVDWSIPDSCSGQYNFNDDCTVVANFERLANKYMITFVNYDWTVLQQSEMEYGSKPKYMWETPEKLVEWYTNTFRWWNPEINSTTIVEGAQVYTATFTSVANNYTVLFSWNGAVWNMPWQSFIYWVSQKLSKNSFVMDWYKFIWWNTESNWSWTWYADEESVKNLATSWVITLYAQWWVNTYVVVFSWNNNTSWFTSNQDMELWESENLNENNFVRDWYTFSWRNTQEDWSWKWYSDEELVNNLASSAWEIVTLFAQWTPNPYTIAFNGNWASTWVMESQSMVYDVERILNENKFVREWYSFKWWNTKSDWTWTPYADKALVKNLATSGSVTLYAQWWKNNSWWSSSWWGSGWWTKKKDDCPNGDFSWDYYDKKCWTDVNTWKIEEKVENKPIIIPVKTDTTKKCSIEWSKHSAEVNRAYVWACENWIIKSNTIQGAKLWEYLNRAEMAKIVTVFEMLVLDAKPNRSKDCSAFADSISWYNSEMKNYMITSCQLERMWIHTADHKPIRDFMPKKFVSRAEFWTILSRILRWKRYEASKNSSKYYVDHLSSLKNDNILTNIDPNLKERRSYAILMIYRAAKSLWKA